MLNQAKKAGVPVVAIDSGFGNPKNPVTPGISAQVWQGRDIMAFLQVQALLKAKPGAKVGLIGIGAPVPALKYLNARETYYAKKAGLTVLGTQDNATDDVTGGEKAGNALIQRYADMDAVIGYNDPSAVGAVIAAKASGKTLTVDRPERHERRDPGGQGRAPRGDRAGRLAGHRLARPSRRPTLLATKTLRKAEARHPAAAHRDEGERQLDPELGRGDQGDQVVRCARPGTRSGPGWARHARLTR